MRHSSRARRSPKSRLAEPAQPLKLESLETRVYPGELLVALGWSVLGAGLAAGRGALRPALHRTEGVAYLRLVTQEADRPRAVPAVPVLGTTAQAGSAATASSAGRTAADFPSWQSEFDLFGDALPKTPPRRGPAAARAEGFQGAGSLPLGGGAGGAAPGVAARIDSALPSAPARAAGESADWAMVNGIVGILPRISAPPAAAPAGHTPAALPAAGPVANAAPVQAESSAATAAPQAADRLPLEFEANRGQTDAEVRFLARAPGYSLFLTPTEAVVALPRTAPVSAAGDAAPATVADVVDMQMLGANPAAAVVGRDELAGKSNYFLGNDPSRWVTDVPHYASVAYQGVYPGIDLVYYGTQDHQLEYDWKVAPGADPGAIRLNFAGADGLSVDAQGNLVVHTAGGDLVQHAPVLYQEVNGGKQAVAGGYVLQGAGQVGFAVGSHDAGRPLVIDPVMNYATHLGGGRDDGANAVAVDRTGAAYVTGQTASVDFPATPGAFQTTLRSTDAFVAKLNADGTDLAYATYLGSPSEDAGTAIAVDANGNAYVAGTTNSASFPVTASAFQKAYGGGGDGFVAKLNATGSALVYASYLGGTSLDSASGLSVDANGIAYVVGQTASANFPTTAGAYQRTLQGAADAFVAKVAADGSTLAYATLLGGAGADGGKGIAVNAAGNAYVVGDTTGSFPVTSGAAQTTFGGGAQDAFVARLSADGTSLGYATYLGGNNREDSAAIAVDAAGNAYVTGQTASANFPTTSSAFQKAYGGNGDAFVAKLNPAGSAWVYATFLGGSGADQGTGLAWDATSDSITVVGGTASPNFPTTPDPLQVSLSGPQDAFLVRLNSAGTVQNYGTYVGGSGAEAASAVALDALGNAYVAGATTSANFPATPGAFRPASGGGQDAFVTKIGAAVPPDIAPACSVSTPSLVVQALDPCGAGLAPSGFSEAGVRYFDGTLQLAQTDLGSQSFGTPWGQTRSWTNNPGYAGRGFNGSGMVIAQLPYLLQTGNGPAGGTVVLVENGTEAVYFDRDSLFPGHPYQARFFAKETLSVDGATGDFLLTDTAGNRLRFHNFDVSLPVNARGQFIQETDPYGNVVAAVTARTADGKPTVVQRTGPSGGTTVTDQYMMQYVAGGTNAGLLQSVTLQRVSGGNTRVVRQAVYTYYDGVEPNGNAGDLKTATVNDGAGRALDTTYYRYYRPGETGGYAHGLKLVIGPQSFARLAAAVSNPFTATDSQAALYADYQLRYDARQRVTQAVIQGAGSSTAAGGQGTYTYSYAQTSTNPVGFNSWKYKTSETLPDGSRNIVYANSYGQVMLMVFHDGASGLEWNTFYSYDAGGRLVLTAAPSAVSGYDESRADLLNNVGGHYQHLRDNAGLIASREYVAARPGEAGGGTDSGFFRRATLQNGQLGAPVPQAAATYQTFSLAADDAIAVPASSQVYRNDDGTGAETTRYVYSMFPGTLRPQTVTVTRPAVTAAQNGPGTADVDTVSYDSYGQVVRTATGSSADLRTVAYAYDNVTGAVTQVVVDPGALRLTTDVVVDDLGRPTTVTDPNRNVTYTVYNDPNHEVRTYVGWHTGGECPGGCTTGPTQVTREDRAHSPSYVETLTMSAAPHQTGGRPDGTEAVGNVQTLARTFVSPGGQVVESDAYVDLSGLAYSTNPTLGTAGKNYYATLQGYDVRGRPDRTLSPTGTLTLTTYDDLSRPVSQAVGLSDADLVTVVQNVYDGGRVGDGNRTQMTQLPGGGAAPRVTQNFYDWRDRLVASKQGVQSAPEDTTTHRPIYYTEYDNLNEAVAQERYDGDGITVSIGSDGVPVKPSADLLRARSTAEYDNQGRVFRTSTFDVDQTTGDISAAGLTANTFYNHSGEVIATTAPGGLATKYQRDGAGRVVVAFVTDAGGNTTWPRAGSAAADTVLTQTETQYDANGNPLLVTTKERFHDEKATGALSDPNGGAAGHQAKARDSYAAFYYDAADRPTATVNAGTNGGVAFTRPPTVPDRTDTLLVASQTYNDAGWVQDVTDPRGLVTHTDYDNLGRTVRTVAAYTGGGLTDNTDATTAYIYDGAGHVLTQTAALPNGLHQTTQYVYGARTANGDAINSNDRLSAMLYPDKSTGDPSDTEAEAYTSNALGQRISMTDRNGTQHAYAYDVLGRPTSDTVTMLGGGVDGTVQQLATAYDTGGRPYLFTSYDAPDGNVVNQVQRTFNGLSQLTAEYQSHAGAVDPAATPSVQYVYSELSNGANHSRLEQMIYPNGRTLDYNYSAGLNDRISRVSSLDDGVSVLEAYAYLGLDTVVQRRHPETGVDLSYVQQAGEPNGDAGDPYTGLDRFGRVVDQRWLNPSSGNTTDRFQYGYDRDGNPLYRDNLVNPAFGELYHAGGAGNGYDPLNRLTDFGRGTLNDTHDDLVGGASHSQSWTLDASGNWVTLTTDGAASSRDHNAQNQISDIDGNPLAYDNNGDLIADQAGQVYVYDAWNRLVQVVDAGGNLLASYSYDALGRRIVETTDATRDLYFSAAGQVIEEQAGGATAIQYVWSAAAPDTLVLRDRDPYGSGTLSERLYVQQDAGGSVTALVDPTGTVVERYVYDPYGLATVLDANGNAQDPTVFNWKYLFQGRRYEASTGLYNFGDIDYSPTLGRQIDAVIHTGGTKDLNFYQYAGSNPVATPAGAEDKYGRIKAQFHWDREGKRDASAAVDVARAWKDPDYRSSLSAAELAALPPHPAGRMGASAAEWDGGGTDIWISAGGQCGSVGNVICGQSYGWCPHLTVSFDHPCKIQWGRVAKGDTTAPVDVARAWKDPDYRSSLGAAELAALPPHPAGGMDWNPADWGGDGGTAKWISAGGQCGSVGNVICGQSYGWCPHLTVSFDRPCKIEWGRMAKRGITESMTVWQEIGGPRNADSYDVLRAWKDPDYRSSLGAAELAALPPHPAGRMGASAAEWDGGGTDIWISAGGQCGSFGTVICGQSYGWCPNPTISAARPCHIEWK